MSNRYGLWYEIFTHKEHAEEYLAEMQTKVTPYMKKKHYEPYMSETIMDNRPVWVVWTHSKTCKCTA